MQLLSSPRGQAPPSILEIFCLCAEGRGACHHLNSMGKVADNGPYVIFQNEHGGLYHGPTAANTRQQE